ncbi:MAG TPA: class I SAM-dependent methyltransferase [Vicinamibacterales bacterium]|nr:class I SAM-dependent methyltransferase [Vicinamibacterales bacterium]
MISPKLLALVRCADCRAPLDGAATDLACRGCGRRYTSPPDYLDMRPREQFDEQTKYLDEALHADARHERVSPPLLGSRIRNDMLRAFLAPRPGELVVDLGCGSGRALLWNRDLGAAMTGIDIAPFFSREARDEVDLLLGDLRKLPFADGTFDKAWSLDVLEHLSPEALAAMLTEAARVLKPGGSLFVYTHVRRNAPIAAGLRWINRLAKQLERVGLIDLRQEHLRKSDHLNPLRDVPHLEQVVDAAGFRIEKIRYYTPLVGGFVENILVRVAERAMAKRAERRHQDAADGTAAAAGAGDRDEAVRAAAIREARTVAKRRIASRGPTYAALRGLSFAMKLDLLLFGRVRSGPFFALLVKK